MTIQAISRPRGWPTYPRKTAPAPITRENLCANAVATALHRGLRQVRGQRDFVDVAEPILSGFLERGSVVSGLEVVDAGYLTARCFVAENFQRAIDILLSPEFTALALKAEQQARDLVREVVVGGIDKSDLGGISAWGGVSNEFYDLYKAFPAVAACFRINEVFDAPLIHRLMQSATERESFMNSRKGSKSLAEATSACAELLDTLEKFAHYLGEVDAFSRVLHPYDILKGILSPGGLRDHNFARFGEVVSVDRCVGHDLANTFVGELLGLGDRLEMMRNSPAYLLLFLSGGRHLASHIRFLEYLLTVNKYRLDGLIPPRTFASLEEVLETSSRAVAYRFALPFNTSGEAKKGWINCLVERCPGVSTIPEFLGLMLYHLQKNSGKALEETGRDKTELMISSRVAPDVDYPEVLIVTVEDNALGFQLNSIMGAAAGFVDQPWNAEAVAQHPVLAKVAQWRDKPHLIRTLTIGEVLDILFVARITGFASKSMSSGLGLDEVAEMAQVMGADVLMTNTIEGNALTNIIIGEESQRHAVIRRELGIT